MSSVSSLAGPTLCMPCNLLAQRRSRPGPVSDTAMQALGHLHAAWSVWHCVSYVPEECVVVYYPSLMSEC